MSYCRFQPGYSEVYLYPTGSGIYWSVCCCRCRLHRDLDSVVLTSPEEALKHLQEHQVTGHLVPVEAIEELENQSEGVYWHGRNTEE